MKKINTKLAKHRIDVPTPKITNKIKMFLHCKKCMKIDRKKDKWSSTEKLDIGWTKKGLQVWCENCDTNILALDFKGQKVDYDK